MLVDGVDRLIDEAELHHGAEVLDEAGVRRAAAGGERGRASGLLSLLFSQIV